MLNKINYNNLKNDFASKKHKNKNLHIISLNSSFGTAKLDSVSVVSSNVLDIVKLFG